MKKQHIYEIDFTDCKYYMQFHETIRKAMNWPDFYGKNWSVFWDLLSEPADNDFIRVKGL